MNIIEQGKIYKADIVIDINANVFKNKIFKIENFQLKFLDKIKSEVIELENSIVSPSPVNAHTHLELTKIDKAKLNFSSFIDWIISLIIEKREKSSEFLIDSYLYGKILLKKISHKLLEIFYLQNCMN